MEKWLQERLTSCLGFEVPTDMIRYIMSIKDSNELDAYFDTLLNVECEDHRMFISDCKQRLFCKVLPNKKKQQQQQDEQMQKKSQNIDAGSMQIKQNNENAAPDVAGQQQQTKKKTKFVSLYSNDGKVIGDTILLKGRRICECQASEHRLINNCLGCGRIVCLQEGSGPCIFCGELVCTNEEMKVLKENNKKSQNLMKSLKEKGGGEALKKALEQRDRLLEYDRNSEKRTTVIDDELDYFQESSVWLSDAEREKLQRLKQDMQNKKNESRARRKIKIDFAGREVDEDFEMKQECEEHVKNEISNINAQVQDNGGAIKKIKGKTNSGKYKDTDTDISDHKFGLRPIFVKPKYNNNINNNSGTGTVQQGLEVNYNRVQDKEFLEMQDMRYCLSMHQPWASLLVAGIKKHEGRVWYSEHRGRLWIAATAKDPHAEDITELENFYKNHYNDSQLSFPEYYPTSCLLGCVNVDDVLAQEEYRELYPNGESESPYVFICTKPEQLPVVFPIKGQPKIYQIDPKIHNAACKMLLRAKAANAN